MEFLDKFNELSGGRFNYFRVKAVEIIDKPPTVNIELLVPYDMLDTLINEEQKKEILGFAEQIIPQSINVNIKYIKSYVNESLVKLYVLEYFKKNHPTILVDDNEIVVRIDDNCVDIAISLKKMFFDYFKNIDLAGNINKYLGYCYCDTSKITIIDSKTDLDYNTDFATEESITMISRRIRTTNHRKLVGKDIMDKPKYIIDVKETEKDAIYCGKVVDYKKSISKKLVIHTMCSPLKIAQVFLCCKAFTKAPGNNEYDTIQMGQEIIASGNVEIDTFLHDSVLLIRNLHFCEIDHSSIILKEELKDTPKFYKTVQPYKYEDMRQSSLFEEKVAECPPSIKGKTYVVFDFETTGLDKVNDQVIEIGAVKVVDGIITEGFSSFLKPSVLISPEITKITSITNSDVENAPLMSDVVADFYKFTRGAILVAHNASFDKAFLDRYAKAERYMFDNLVLDTCGLAKGVVPAKNYKLITLCEYLNISLEGAHRAVNDCEATAKLFIELAKLGAIV